MCKRHVSLTDSWGTIDRQAWSFSSPSLIHVGFSFFPRLDCFFPYAGSFFFKLVVFFPRLDCFSPGFDHLFLQAWCLFPRLNWSFFPKAWLFFLGLIVFFSRLDHFFSRLDCFFSRLDCFPQAWSVSPRPELFLCHQMDSTIISELCTLTVVLVD